MKTAIFKSFLIIFLFSFGCSKENLVGIKSNNASNGSISLSINKTTVPSDVQQLIATLSRQNYDTLETSTYVNNDSINVLQFENIPIGDWHLKFNALNSARKVIYAGETNVTIIEDETVDVFLTLTSLGSGTGNINIYINWGDKWTDYYNNPVFTQYDSQDSPIAITQPRVIFDNGIYKMWYLNLYNSAKSNIWYAESNNGINWHSVQNTPVLMPSDSGSWDDYSVAPGIVFKEGNNFKMYYNGYHDQYGKWNIGLAVSTDGIHWEKNNEAILVASDEEYQIGVSSVINFNQVYYMFYSVRHYPYYNISLATSTDGIHWKKYENNPILSVTKDWEGTGIYGPSVIYDNGKFEMMYMNADANAFGFAISNDGINWTKDNNPIFTINDTYKKWAGRIAYPDFINLNSELRLYYTGFKNYSDGTIAFAKKIK